MKVALLKEKKGAKGWDQKDKRSAHDDEFDAQTRKKNLDSDH